MYQSPLRTAGFAAPVTNSKALLLARKKLLAELELSGTTTIQMNGRELSRQDIIHLFDELGDERYLAYHLAIFADEPLLKFLENGTVTQAGWQENPLYGDEGFLRFVSPFFALSINELVRQCLQQEQMISSYNIVISRRQLLLMQDVEECFTYARRFYLEKRSELLVFASRLQDTTNGRYQEILDPVTRASSLHYVTKETVTPDEIQAWCNPQQLTMLNELPDDLFGELRYKLASSLNELCVICDRTNHALRTAYAALQIAATIHCGPELNKIIRDNIEIIGGKLPLMEIGPNKKPVGKRPAKISWTTIAFVLLLLVRIAGCLSSCADKEPAKENLSMKHEAHHASSGHMMVP